MPNPQFIERRREPRHRLSLPVWWRAPGQVGTQHGWMLDVSGHGAALMTSRQSRPAVGDRVDVSLVDPDLRPGPGVSSHLLKRATVHRLDPLASSLDRVALHFDGSLWDRDPALLMKDLIELLPDEIPV